MVILISQLPILFRGAPQACSDITHVHSSPARAVVHSLTLSGHNAAQIRSNTVVAVQIIPVVQIWLSKEIRLA